MNTTVTIEQKYGKIELLFTGDCGKFNTSEILDFYRFTPEKLLEVLQSAGLDDEEGALRVSSEPTKEDILNRVHEVLADWWLDIYNDIRDDNTELSAVAKVMDSIQWELHYKKNFRYLDDIG